MNISGRIFEVITSDYDVEIASATNLTAVQEQCVPLHHLYVILVSFLPALALLENCTFLVAVLMYRRKLKHNNVYTYVTSALCANILSSLWAFYHFLNYYFGFESIEPTPWWAFRKGKKAFLFHLNTTV